MPESLPQRDENQADAGAEPESFIRHDEINILREKTFTPELRDLVARVVGHDSEEAAAQDAADGLDDLTEQDIVLRLHRLFYNTRNLVDNQDINTAFDPFELDRGAEAGPPGRAVLEYIRLHMADLSFANYAILKYDTSQKCYSPADHNLARYEAGSVNISLHDRVFKKLLSSPDGIILGAADIQNDPYLCKTFVSARTGARSPVYIILLSDVYRELSFELAAPGTEVVSAFLPSSLLMIELFDDAENANPAPIANLLRKRLSVPFFITDAQGDEIHSSFNLEKLSHPYSVMEYFFNIFLLMPDGIGLRLRMNSRGDGSMLFVMKYILSKLNAALTADSALVQMVNEYIVILTNRSSIGQVRALIDEYIGLYRGSLSVVEFHAADFTDSSSLIQEIVLND